MEKTVRREDKAPKSVDELKDTPGRPKISVIITTFNEEVNIADCLRSVMWADEIFLVDSFSTDRTVEVAREFPIRIERRKYYGSAAQKNWSLDQVHHDWVLILDADERVPEKLAREILVMLIQGPERKGYYIRRQNIMFDKVIRHSGWSTDKVIRFFRRLDGRYPDRRVHADLDIEGPTPVLREPMVHYTYRSLDQYFVKVLKYAEWGAAQGLKEGRKAGFVEIGIRPLWRFHRSYILQLGFLDGLHGLVVSALQAFGVFLKYAWLWEYRIRQRMGEEIQLPDFDESSDTWQRPSQRDGSSE